MGISTIVARDEKKYPLTRQISSFYKEAKSLIDHSVDLSWEKQLSLVKQIELGVAAENGERNNSNLLLINQAELARDLLIRGNLKLIFKRVIRFKINRPYLDLDELLSDCIYSLMKLVNAIGREGSAFNWRRGSRLSTFICRKLFFDCADCSDKYFRENRKKTLCIRSLEFIDNEFNEEDERSYLLSKILKVAIMLNNTGKIPDLDLEIFYCRFGLNGYDQVHAYEEIKRLLNLNMTKQRINFRLNKTLRLIRDFFLRRRLLTPQQSFVRFTVSLRRP